MRQAHARKVTDAYLDAPKRSERYLRVVDERLDEVPLGERTRIVEDLRVEAPLVEVPHVDPAVADPDWARPFADARWDDRLGSSMYEERDGRRTVLVTGRPEGTAVPRRDSAPGATARMRRQTPTRARLAGRPDRVALWAVCLGLLMAAIAGVSGNGQSSSSAAQGADQAAPLVESR